MELVARLQEAFVMDQIGEVMAAELQASLVQRLDVELTRQLANLDHVLQRQLGNHLKG